jgi:general L-amino acid transport system permease protein
VATETQRVDAESIAPAWWRDERKRGFVAQILVILVTALLFWFLISNMLVNLRVPLGFDFLTLPAGFQLSFTLLPITLDSPIWWIIETGAVNTLLASAIAVVLATILGFLVGVMRLSSNWLIARIATAYIEVMRNVPLLVQLLFWYVGIVKALPGVRQSIMLGPDIALNVRGLYLPAPIAGAGFGMALGGLIVGIAAAWAVGRWAYARQSRTGRPFPTFSVGLALIIVLPLLGNLLAESPVTWDVPKLQGFNFQGGLHVQPELIALVLGLTSYTAAYIAEIVRGGIVAISHGQAEAALALGLKRSWTLRLVVIPQALRVIVPPLTSQYLNIVKNSTLAGMVGFPDLYSVIGTSQNQTGRSVECIGILMVFYLVISLLISTFMNWYNRRIALVER